MAAEAPRAGTSAPGRRVLADGALMALGTLTAWRVPAPRAIDRAVGGVAMLLAPMAAIPLAVLAGLVVYTGDVLGLPPLLTAALAVGSVCLGNRGLHLDGLSDTADALAASYDRERALEVMHRGDAGPMGAATLVLVLLAQCAALAGAVASGHGVAAVVLALVASRAVVPACCARGVPAAQRSGLGVMVAGTVPPLVAVTVGVVLAAVAALLPGLPWWQGPVAVVLGFAAAGALLHRCVTRFGGITGDVLGACIEAAALAMFVGLST
ncbi:adenosylcobinamide-GDP ribazoletransferase [Saccharomonospora piscinae]|nr:adenosylcobinamide-GDP ribazoletransferase [Saccharomonospora piscinae]